MSSTIAAKRYACISDVLGVHFPALRFCSQNSATTSDSLRTARGPGILGTLALTPVSSAPATLFDSNLDCALVVATVSTSGRVFRPPRTRCLARLNPASSVVSFRQRSATYRDPVFVGTCSAPRSRLTSEAPCRSGQARIRILRTRIPTERRTCGLGHSAVTAKTECAASQSS